MIPLLLFLSGVAAFLVVHWALSLRFYLRWKTGEYLEEQAALIVVGRHTNIYTPAESYWVTITDRGCYYGRYPYQPITWRTWRLKTGWRGWLALWEDLIGVSLVGAFLNRRQQEPRASSKPMVIQGQECGGEQ